VSLSSFTFSGTLIKDPEKRFTPTSIPVTNLTVAVCYIPRGGQENLASQIIRINAWRDLAEECERKLKTGDKVVISGRIQINSYTTNEGKKKKEIEVDANSVITINNLLSLQPPPQEEIETKEKPVFKKSERITESTSNLEEMVANTEEIPF